MTKDEFITFDIANSRRLGHYVTIDRIGERRKKRIENVTPQYLEIVDALRNEKLNFMCFELVRFNKYNRHKFISDIILPDFNIVIRFYDKDNEYSVAKKQAYFLKARKRAFPIFVEKDETLDFTLSKIQDCIMKSMTEPKEGIYTKIVKIKRPRIKAIKVNKNYGYRRKI